MPDDRRPRIVISYDPSFRPGSGVASSASWHGSLRNQMRQTFGCKDEEKIIGLVIDEDAITAYFGRK